MHRRLGLVSFSAFVRALRKDSFLHLATLPYLAHLPLLLRRGRRSQIVWDGAPRACSPFSLRLGPGPSVFKHRVISSCPSPECCSPNTLKTTKGDVSRIKILHLFQAKFHLSTLPTPPCYHSPSQPSPCRFKSPNFSDAMSSQTHGYHTLHRGASSPRAWGVLVCLVTSANANPNHPQNGIHPEIRFSRALSAISPLLFILVEYFEVLRKTLALPARPMYPAPPVSHHKRFYSYE